MRFKKIVCAIIAVSFILSLITACQTKTEEPDGADTSEQVEKPVSEPSSEEQTPPVVEDEPVEEPVTEAEDDTSEDETAGENPNSEFIYSDENLTEETAYLRENLPSMDGSTSLIPLEAGLRARIFGISMSEATAMVSHTTTYGAFERLLSGEAEIIFSTPLSDEQYSAAEDAGKELELVPIAAESFVFIVNAENPVDTLTQQQIKDIYSGKITNWKDVGGNDAEIIAYQRNQTSGSQNYMREFMGDTELTAITTETVPGTMEGLMDVIASYDNSVDAIGYSVYAYAADMYGLGDKLKFIKVDGIEPTKETMSSHEYPLMNFNYAIYDKNTENEAVLRTVDWICSDDGQQAIADAGYIPADENAHREYFELTGTGEEKPEDYKEPTSEYVACVNYFDNRLRILPINITLPETIPNECKYDYKSGSIYDTKVLKGIEWKIDCLTNKTLEEKVNACIAEMVDAADLRGEKYMSFLKQRNAYSLQEEKKKNPDFWANMPQDKYISCYPLYNTGTLSMMEYRYDDFQFIPTTIIEVSVKNAYLCVLSKTIYFDETEEESCFYAEAVYFDMVTGEELSLSDLFFKGVDAASAINSAIKENSLGYYDFGFFIEYKMLTDFTALPADDSFTLTFDTSYFNYKNTVFFEGAIIELDFEPGVLCIEQPRPVKGMFTDGVQQSRVFLTRYYYENSETLNDGTLFTVFLPEKGENAIRNKKINDYMRNYYKTYLNKETVLSYVPNFEFLSFEFKVVEYIGNYIFFVSSYSESSIHFKYYCYIYNSVAFDIETGEVVNFKDMVLDGWENGCRVFDRRNGELDKSEVRKFLDSKTAYNCNVVSVMPHSNLLGIDNESSTCFSLYNNNDPDGDMIYLVINTDYVKFRE